MIPSTSAVVPEPFCAAAPPYIGWAYCGAAPGGYAGGGAL